MCALQDSQGAHSAHCDTFMDARARDKEARGQLAFLRHLVFYTKVLGNQPALGRMGRMS